VAIFVVSTVRSFRESPQFKSALFTKLEG